jgi:hypothetical protein
MKKIQLEILFYGKLGKKKMVIISGKKHLLSEKNKK